MSKINFKLLIIGRENYNLMKKFIENHLNDNVKIIGLKKSISFLKLADLFILTSKFEGLPTSCLKQLLQNL